MKRFVLTVREHPEHLEDMRKMLTPERWEVGQARLKAAEDELTKLGIPLSPSKEKQTNQK